MKKGVILPGPYLKQGQSVNMVMRQASMSVYLPAAFENKIGITGFHP